MRTMSTREFAQERLFYFCEGIYWGSEVYDILKMVNLIERFIFGMAL